MAKAQKLIEERKKALIANRSSKLAELAKQDPEEKRKRIEQLQVKVNDIFNCLDHT